MAKLEYTVVVSQCRLGSDLPERVNEMIAQGWKPQGGIAAISGSNKAQALQAMVREPATERYGDDYVF